MTLKDFKERYSLQGGNTGAKKAVATIAIVAAFMVAGTPAVYASVPASNILGDAQISEDRREIKIDDAQDIARAFYGFNKYGNQTITMDDIRKAIELSNVLNGYYFDGVNFTNTTKEEVLDLDVDRIYDKYIIAKYNRGNVEDFCSQNLTNKPAIDAFITFSCGTVSNNVKKSVATKVNNVIASEGFDMTQNPRAVITNNSLYVIVEVEGQTRLVELNGEAAQEIVTMCNTLDNHYNIAVNNIGGYSDYYENSFAYNGVDAVSLDSVWLSLPDETKQQELLSAISAYELLEDDYSYEITADSPEAVSKLSRTERELLRSLGYDQQQVRDAVKKEAYLNKVMQIRLSK